MISSDELVSKFILKRNNIIFIIILAIGFILRIYDLGKYSFWYDEAIIAGQRTSFLNFFHSFSNIKDIYHPVHLYASVIYYWQNFFGNSEISLRVTSVIFSMLCIICLYFFAKKLFDSKIALLSSFLLSIAPWHIYYSQELASYSAVSFLSLFSAFVLFNMLTGGEKLYYFIYIVIASINTYFHYMALLILFVFSLFLYFNLKKDRNFLNKFIIFHSFLFISILPCLIICYNIIKHMLFNTNEFNRNDFPVWVNNLKWQNIVFTFKNLAMGYNTDFYNLIGFFPTVIFISFFIYGVSKFWKNKNDLFLAFCVVLPIAILFLVSKINLCYVDRYFFPIFPFYILGIAKGITKCNKFFFFPIVGLIIIFNIFGLNNYYANKLNLEYFQRIGVHKKRDMDIYKLVKYLSNNFKSKDVIFETTNAGIYSLKFYIKNYSNNSFLAQQIDRGSLIYSIDPPDTILYVDKYYFGPLLTSNPISLRLSSLSRAWIIVSSWESFEDFSDNCLSEQYRFVRQINEKLRYIDSKYFANYKIYLFGEK